MSLDQNDAQLFEVRPESVRRRRDVQVVGKHRFGGNTARELHVTTRVTETHTQRISVFRVFQVTLQQELVGECGMAEIQELLDRRLATYNAVGGRRLTNQDVSPDDGRQLSGLP